MVFLDQMLVAMCILIAALIVVLLLYDDLLYSIFILHCINPSLFTYLLDIELLYHCLSCVLDALLVLIFVFSNALKKLVLLKEFDFRSRTLVDT